MFDFSALCFKFLIPFHLHSISLLMNSSAMVIRSLIKASDLHFLVILNIYVSLSFAVTCSSHIMITSWLKQRHISTARKCVLSPLY